MTESTAFGAAYAAGLSIDFWETDLNTIRANQGGYDVFTPTMSEQLRSSVFARWDDAVKRSFDLSKFTQN